MSIKYIVNGSFRSGTSFVWKEIKEQNNDLVVLYEPCHENLTALLAQGDDSLHGLDLWSEYLNNPDILSVVESNKPSPIYNYTDGAHLKYLSELNSLDKPLVLQTNRWHLYLERVRAVQKDVKYIHVVRDPCHVYNSILKAYVNQGSSKLTRCLKSLLPRDYIAKRAFNTKNHYKECCRLVGVVPNINFSAWQMFLYTWIVSNEFVLDFIANESGFVFTYDKMLDSPGVVDGVFRSYGLDTDFVNNIQDRGVRGDIHSESLERSARELGVSGRFGKIKEFFDEGLLSF